MNDRRETPSNGRVAHVSLKGSVAAERFVEGEARAVRVPVALLRVSPGGARDRELLLGEGFLALEARDGWVFGMADRDGFVGYVAAEDLGPPAPARHVVGVARSYAKPSPDLKATEPITPLPFGALVLAGAREGDWVQVPVGGEALWMPAVHLRPREARHGDPAAVARLFLGTPYLWGGNSAFGIDCSGLIQAAMLACGISCPGDSDQQAGRLGAEIGLEAPRMRGDLYFWKGHVGLLSDPDTLLHANAHRMAVTEDPLEEVIARIADKEGQGVLCRRRVTPPRG